MPFATPGAGQTFNLVDLPPDAGAAVEVEAVNGAGNISAAAKAMGRTSSRLIMPQVPAAAFQPKTGEPKALGSAKVYAFPEITKIDPTTGKVLHETMEDVSRKNPVWDGAAGVVRLAAARAEIASFQIGIDGQAQDVETEASDLSGSGTIPNTGVKLWRNWYVNRQSEYALPWAGTVSCPMPDNHINGQVHQAVTVDYHIPKDAKPGEYAGKVTLTAGGNSAALGLRVRVYTAVIPDEIFFNPELNCYSGPGEAGTPQFFNSYKIAHYHRCTINRVPYTQGGKVHADWAADVGDSGTVTALGHF